MVFDWYSLCLYNYFQLFAHFTVLIGLFIDNNRFNTYIWKYCIGKILQTIASQDPPEQKNFEYSVIIFTYLLSLLVRGGVLLLKNNNKKKNEIIIVR